MEKLKKIVYEANIALWNSDLVLHTFGNVSGIDRERGVVIIKPSGVSYDRLSPETMVGVSLETGEVVDGELNPSSDTPTHLEIYRGFPRCGGVVHTHSQCATAFAQALTPVRCMGTTHADYFHGDIPVTRALSEEEVREAYEANTGLVIVERFSDLDPASIPAVLVANHGPFAWGTDPHNAVHNAVLVEYLATMELQARSINPQAPVPAPYLIDKHYLRKHGRNAYYGQGRQR